MFIFSTAQAKPSDELADTGRLPHPHRRPASQLLLAALVAFEQRGQKYFLRSGLAPSEFLQVSFL